MKGKDNVSNLISGTANVTYLQNHKSFAYSEKIKGLNIFIDYLCISGYLTKEQCLFKNKHMPFYTENHINISFLHFM